jgi:uracil-DNA glycosylase family 4
MIERKHPLAECERCPLAKKKCVPTNGPADASIAVVSRSPGKYDVRAKQPFGGPSGVVLDHLLNLYNVQRSEVLTTNVVLCESDEPPKEAISACRPRLISELSNARTIIAAGTEAIATLTKQTTINSARGYVNRLRDSPQSGVRVIAANNPALVLRDDSTFPNLVRDFRLALDPIPEPEYPEVDWTNNVKEGRRWLQILLEGQYPNLSTDIETKGLRASAELVCIGFSADGRKAISFGESVCTDDYTYRNYIAPLVTKRDTRFIYHNGKFDVRNLRAHGVRARVDEDTILLSWALDERSDEEAVHKLDYLLMNEMGWKKYEPREVREWKQTVGRLERQRKFSELTELPTPESLYEYNAMDCGGTAQLFPVLWKRAIADGVSNVYRTHLLRASEALVRVELVGIPYDINGACDILEQQVWPKLIELQEEMRLIVGDGKYNPRSNKQNSELVHDDWKVLHNLRYPEEKARSVDKAVYTEIKEGRFVLGGYDDGSKRIKRDTAIRWAERFADYQEWEKQRSTYLEGLALRAEANDGILYTDFNLHTTATGRLSSKNPNLQNITRTKPWLPDIRSLFMARRGSLLINADYSQAELRSIAKLSGDSGLVNIYRTGRDLHDEVSERFFGPDYTKENRQNVKNMNFGVAYLQSAETFQEKHGIPKDQAQEFIDWWWQNFTGVRAWTNKVSEQVTSVGEVVSPFGHKRRFYLFASQAAKNAAIREGINFLPQNIAANITLHALVELAGYFDEDRNYCEGRLDSEQAQVVLNVHDSILVNSTVEYADEAMQIMYETMVAAPMESIGWDFPYEVDIQIGERWGKMEDVQMPRSGAGSSANTVAAA